MSKWKCKRCQEDVASYDNLHIEWQGKRYEYGTHYHKWCWELVRIGKELERAIDRSGNNDPYLDEALYLLSGHLLGGNCD